MTGTRAATSLGLIEERVRAATPVESGERIRVNRYADLVKELPRLAAEFGTRGEPAFAAPRAGGAGATARSTTAEEGVIVPIKIVRRPPPPPDLDR